VKPAPPLPNARPEVALHEGPPRRRQCIPASIPIGCPWPEVRGRCRLLQDIHGEALLDDTSITSAALGLGHAPDAPDPDRYDKMAAHATCWSREEAPPDSPRRGAGRKGARVILADRQGEFGGRCR
jgi:hypothetical protein